MRRRYGSALQLHAPTLPVANSDPYRTPLTRTSPPHTHALPLPHLKQSRTGFDHAAASPASSLNRPLLSASPLRVRKPRGDAGPGSNKWSLVRSTNDDDAQLRAIARSNQGYQRQDDDTEYYGKSDRIAQNYSRTAAGVTMRALDDGSLSAPATEVAAGEGRRAPGLSHSESAPGLTSSGSSGQLRTLPAPRYKPRKVQRAWMGGAKARDARWDPMVLGPGQTDDSPYLGVVPVQSRYDTTRPDEPAVFAQDGRISESLTRALGPGAFDGSDGGAAFGSHSRRSYIVEPPKSATGGDLQTRADVQKAVLRYWNQVEVMAKDEDLAPIAERDWAHNVLAALHDWKQGLDTSVERSFTEAERRIMTEVFQEMAEDYHR